MHHLNQCTDPGVTWGNGWEGCPLVVHCWANLQSVHWFRCYENSAEREMSVSACTRSMPGCCLLIPLNMSVLVLYQRCMLLLLVSAGQHGERRRVCDQRPRRDMCAWTSAHAGLPQQPRGYGWNDRLWRMAAHWCVCSVINCRYHCCSFLMVTSTCSLFVLASFFSGVTWHGGGSPRREVLMIIGDVFRGWMPFLSPVRQCLSTEWIKAVTQACQPWKSSNGFILHDLPTSDRLHTLCARTQFLECRLHIVKCLMALWCKQSSYSVAITTIWRLV